MSDAVELADEYWSYYRGSAQLWNIDRGDVEQIEHWEDLSPAGVASRLEQAAAFAGQARRLVVGELTERDRGLVAAVQFSAEATAALLPFERDLALVAGPFNFATFVSVLIPGYPLTSSAHGRGYVVKLHSMPSFVEGWIDGLRDGAAAGRVATARGISAAIAAYDALLSRDLVDDPLASQDPPSEMSAREVGAWRAEVAEAIRDSARPALAQTRAVLRDELLPVARTDERPGVCHLPGGDEAYGGLLWASTSTGLSPAAVHELGLRQLALLDLEYRELGSAALGVEDPVELRERLRRDRSLRYSTADEIVADAVASVARAETAVPKWFTRLPRSACNAAAVNSGPMAYHTGPSPDGHRGGTYFFNTSDPTAWTRYQLEVTTFHEAVPGHHTQLALAHEYDLHPVVGELEVASWRGMGLVRRALGRRDGSVQLAASAHRNVDTRLTARRAIDR